MRHWSLDVSSEVDRDIPALPVIEVCGSSPGPALCVLAGVHGCEYTAMAALRTGLAGIDEQSLRGRVVGLPVVNVEAFRARSPFVSPSDGKNLNRCFPGDTSGTFSERLAAVIFDRFVATSDYLIDLHSGDLVEALQPFVLYDESGVTEVARGMAEAFGLPLAIRMPAAQRIAGTTMAAAVDRGIPAMTAEAGGAGAVDEPAVAALGAGLHNVMRHLEMTPAGGRPSSKKVRTFGRFVWLHATTEGWWTGDVRVGDAVAAGDRLGTIQDLFGTIVTEVVAPDDGVLLFMTINPSVARDGVLLGLGAGSPTTE